MNKRNVIEWIIAILAGALTFWITTSWYNSAEATRPIVDAPCYEVVTVVDEEAWTEEVVHPAVYETVHHDAVTETTPAIWANWQPNDTQGPQDYEPIWPVDERGTWILHDQGIPPGHEGPDGVYQKGGGNSPYFYRQAEKVTVIKEAWDEEVLVSEEWTETIEHPEVTHEEETEVDCPEEPEVPDEPEIHQVPDEPQQGIGTPIQQVKQPVQKKVAVPTVVDSGLASVAKDTAGCVTMGEYDQVVDGMRLAKVHEIFDTAGRSVSTHSTSKYIYAMRQYDRCKTPVTDFVYVEFRRPIDGSVWRVIWKYIG